MDNIKQEDIEDICFKVSQNIILPKFKNLSDDDINYKNGFPIYSRNYEKANLSYFGDTILLRKKPEGSVEFLFCIKKVNKTIDMIITINKDVKKNIFFIFIYSRRIYPNPLFK